jgi:hypothetical protein
MDGGRSQRVRKIAPSKRMVRERYAESKTEGRSERVFSRGRRSSAKRVATRESMGEDWAKGEDEGSFGPENCEGSVRER